MSAIEVRPFRRSDRHQLTDLVNAHVQAVVPGVSVSVNAVLSQLEREPGEVVVDQWVIERATLVAEYEARFANPYIAAGRGYVDDVIRPSETRPRLIAGLEALAGKRDTNPRKKHGNIPL